MSERRYSVVDLHHVSHWTKTEQLFQCCKIGTCRHAELQFFPAVSLCRQIDHKRSFNTYIVENVDAFTRGIKNICYEKAFKKLK